MLLIVCVQRGGGLRVRLFGFVICVTSSTLKYKNVSIGVVSIT